MLPGKFFAATIRSGIRVNALVLSASVIGADVVLVVTIGVGVAATRNRVVGA